MEIYFGNTELDVNLNSTIYNYWEDVFWQKLVLPIEDGQYNIFDVLEEQDPASYDVKGDEVSFFTSESEVVYDYNTGIALNWTSTVTYDFVLSYILPESSSDKDEGFRDKIPLSLFPIFVALVVLKFKNKLSSNIFKNK